MNPPTSATSKAWSNGHCAVGMSISIVSPDFKEGNCSTPLTRGSIFSPASSARQATTKSFNETSRTPAFLTWVCSRERRFATVLAAGSEASSAMMPQLSRAAEKASESEVFESMPRTKAALSEKCVDSARANAGTNAFPTSEAPFPWTFQLGPAVVGFYFGVGHGVQELPVARVDVLARRRVSGARAGGVRAGDADVKRRIATAQCSREDIRRPQRGVRP